ncbi:MAG TPA: ABC transporter ATP-binding protein [Bacteroidales bacterium]|nr:ABC transporter ATP-binding protein [Bacteroidales bacterium]
MPAIIMDTVSKSYGKVKALNQLNLTVEKGEIYGFIGPNGAGKSTTIRLLLGFLHANQGKISVLGYDPLRQETEIKKHTGYVSAESFMYSDMKVSDLFRFTEYYYKVKAKDKIRKLVDVLDIELNKKFEQLSFGNRKKVAIACALLHSPELIILDEPSNGLDPVIRINLYELLKEEQAKGATIFFSSHVLSEVQKFSTRIGLIKDGALIRETKATDFTRVGYRQVRIESNSHPPRQIDFSKMNGIAALEHKGNTTQFLFSGDLNELIRLLGSIDLISLEIEEPELENVFMHYFK